MGEAQGWTGGGIVVVLTVAWVEQGGIILVLATPVSINFTLSGTEVQVGETGSDDAFGTSSVFWRLLGGWCGQVVLLAPAQKFEQRRVEASILERDH